MQRRNLFLEPNLSRGANPTLPPSSFNRKPFYWNLRLEDSSGDILASLRHNPHSFTGLITNAETFEELSVTRTTHGRTWQVQSTSSEQPTPTPLMTATHPKWWRRMVEIETEDERFVLCSKQRMGFYFVVHRVTDNLDGPGKRRKREQEGELVGEIWPVSMSKFTLKASFNEHLGLKLPLFCIWLLAGNSVSQHIRQTYRVSSSVSPHDRYDSSFPGTSDEGCFDSHGFDGGAGGGSCGMDSGGGSNFDS